MHLVKQDGARQPVFEIYGCVTMTDALYRVRLPIYIAASQLLTDQLLTALDCEQEQNCQQASYPVTEMQVCAFEIEHVQRPAPV